MIKLYWNKAQLNFEKVEWSGTDTQASRQITFSIPVNPYDKGFKNAPIKLGDIVTLYSDKEKLFVGVVTSREKSAAIGTASYTAKDFMHYLLRSSTSRKFVNKTPEQITKQICTEAGIKCGDLAKTGVNIPKLIFEDQNLYGIILKAYRKAVGKTKKKYMLTMDGKKLSVIVKGKDSKVTLDQGKDITDASYSDTTDNMVNLVKIYNESMQQVGKVEKKKLTQKYGIYQSTYTKEDGVDAKKEAEALMVGITKEASVEAIGDIRAVSGKSLVIYDKATGLNGKFYITSDTHTFENGVHTMQLELAWKNIMESGADESADSSEKTSTNTSTGSSGNRKTRTSTEDNKKTYDEGAVAYYLENGTVFHSNPACASLKGATPLKTTVSGVLRILNKKGKNKGKPKYRKCTKCWR
nr:MAG TPA: 43 kDa tail protein [Caudoviricetes sp.]